MGFVYKAINSKIVKYANISIINSIFWFTLREYSPQFLVFLFICPQLFKLVLQYSIFEFTRTQLLLYSSSLIFIIYLGECSFANIFRIF